MSGEVLTDICILQVFIDFILSWFSSLSLIFLLATFIRYHVFLILLLTYDTEIDVKLCQILVWAGAAFSTRFFLHLFIYFP